VTCHFSRVIVPFSAQTSDSRFVKTAASLSYLGLGLTRSVVQFTVNHALSGDQASRLDARVTAIAEGSATALTKMAATAAEVRSDPSSRAFDLLDSVLDYVLPEQLEASTVAPSNDNANDNASANADTARAETAEKSATHRARVTTPSSSDEDDDADDTSSTVLVVARRSTALYRRTSLRLRGLVARERARVLASVPTPLRNAWNSLFDAITAVTRTSLKAGNALLATVTRITHASTESFHSFLASVSSATQSSSDAVRSAAQSSTEAVRALEQQLSSTLASATASTRQQLSDAVVRLRTLRNTIESTPLRADAAQRVASAIGRAREALTTLQQQQSVQSVGNAVRRRAPGLTHTAEALVRRADEAITSALVNAGIPLQQQEKKQQETTPQQQQQTEQTQETEQKEGGDLNNSFTYPLDQSSVTGTLLEDDE
jgi:hypothetical protein